MPEDGYLVHAKQPDPILANLAVIDMDALFPFFDPYL
jgi:hypothetical protein